MSSGDATWARFEHDRTMLWAEPMSEVVVPVGARAVAERLLRHDPPMPVEIEHAIDQVEDALAATGPEQAARGDLLTREPQLLELLGLQVGGDRVTRDGRLTAAASRSARCTCAGSPP